jgi:two-component system chemotaxis response regulator CheY
MAKTILVVDDSASMRSIVKISLSRAGYDVVEAGDGNQALAALDKTTKVNLVICDVNMPGMDGISFLGAAKKHPRHRFVPVIMLTTESAGTKMQAAKAAGAKAWLHKPFDPPALIDAVSRLVLP